MKRDKLGRGRKQLVVRVMLTLVPLVILAGGGHYLLLQRMEEQWRDFSEEFRRVALPETRRAIDERVEDAFAPVYARIPALLDWHYSPRGRIQESFLILSGRLESSIGSRLLGGLEERIDVALESVGRVMQEEGPQQVRALVRSRSGVAPARAGNGIRAQTQEAIRGHPSVRPLSWLRLRPRSIRRLSKTG